MVHIYIISHVYHLCGKNGDVSEAEHHMSNPNMEKEVTYSKREMNIDQLSWEICHNQGKHSHQCKVVEYGCTMAVWSSGSSQQAIDEFLISNSDRQIFVRTVFRRLSYVNVSSEKTESLSLSRYMPSVTTSTANKHGVWRYFEDVEGMITSATSSEIVTVNNANFQSQTGMVGS